MTQLARLARFARIAAVPAAMVALVAACSNSVKIVPGASDGGTGLDPTDPASCDPSLCERGNECIAGADGAYKCRLLCTKHTDCPFNYSCAVGLDGDGRNYCVKTTSEILPKTDGQWGTPCLAPGGQENNPACSAVTGFACYGTGTTDATAYCTRFDCATDLDCAGGFWCAKVDVGPNVKTDKRTFGKTRSVCLKRSYCSPCNADFDCPVIDGTQSRCAPDDAGGKSCTVPCTTTANCRLDASCTRVLGDGTKVCRPRAGVCKGDGSLCSPCGSDADCPNGFCMRGAYTPERFCSVKSTTTCAPPASGQGTLVKGACPSFTGFADTVIACESASDDETIPKDQCIGLVPFGEGSDIACYTKH
jgi:hypothetical protein